MDPWELYTRFVELVSSILEFHPPWVTYTGTLSA